MRTRLTTNHKLRRTIVSLVALALIAFIIWGVWFLTTMHAIVEQVEQVALPAASAPAFALLAKPPITDLTPPAEELDAEVAPSVQSAPTEQVEAPAQPEPVSPWADALDTVGIPESDRAIILELTMNGFDWNLTRCGCARQVLGLVSDESRFHYLNVYVEREHGSWDAARENFITEGTW